MKKFLFIYFQLTLFFLLLGSYSWFETLKNPIAVTIIIIEAGFLAYLPKYINSTRTKKSVDSKTLPIIGDWIVGVGIALLISIAFVYILIASAL